jgi:hypothetical protein
VRRHADERTLVFLRLEANRVDRLAIVDDLGLGVGDRGVPSR